MKKIITLFIFSILTSVLYSQEFNIVGKWNKDLSTKDEVFNFQEDGTFSIFSYGTSERYGNAFHIEGYVAFAIYEIKNNDSIIDFAFVYRDNKEEAIRYKGLLKIISPTSIEISNELFIDENGEIEKIILTKQNDL